MGEVILHPSTNLFLLPQKTFFHNIPLSYFSNASPDLCKKKPRNVPGLSLKTYLCVMIEPAHLKNNPML
jgi:hypothetical protein